MDKENEVEFGDERAIKVFNSLAEEEKRHLKRLTGLHDEKLSG